MRHTALALRADGLYLHADALASSVGSAGASSTALPAAGALGAGGFSLTNNITIQGGTFTSDSSITDLARAVSDEIMHSVRPQGGLLPQI